MSFIYPFVSPSAVDQWRKSLSGLSSRNRPEPLDPIQILPFLSTEMEVIRLSSDISSISLVSHNLYSSGLFMDMQTRLLPDAIQRFEALSNAMSFISALCIP